MAEPLVGFHTIYGAEGEHATPYMTRLWIGRLRFHIFHRGDEDPDPHDHPWSFLTFPFSSYVEEVATPSGPDSFVRKLRVVKAFRFHYRPAEFAHRVLGRATGRILPDQTPEWDYGRIYTICWRSGFERKWGFWKQDGEQWCWRYWRDYLLSGGKHAPCGEARPTDFAHTYTPTLMERFWRSLGFRYHMGETSEDGPNTGWMVTSTNFKFDWRDRLRLLLTGRLLVHVTSHIDTPSPSKIVNRLDWRIYAPGEKQ